MATCHRHRTDLTVKEKLDIINALRSKTSTKQELQERFNVHISMINRIITNEFRLRDIVNSERRRIRSGSNRLVDEAISKWYHEMKKKNIFVNGPMVRKQATQLARKMNNLTFNANNGWLWRWQKKEKVKFKAESIGELHNSKEVNSDVLIQDNSNEERSDDYKLEDVQTTTSGHNVIRSGYAKNHNDGHPTKEVVSDRRIIDLNFPDIKAEPEDVVLVEFDDLHEPEEICELKTEPHIPDRSMDVSDNTNDPDMAHKSDMTHLPKITDEPNITHEPNIKNEPTTESHENGCGSLQPHQLNKSHEATFERNPVNSRDKYSVYGEHIAHRLRDCERENYEIYIAQRNIDEIMYKLSMGSYALKPPQFQMTGNINSDNDIEQVTISSTNGPSNCISTSNPKANSNVCPTFAPIVIPTTKLNEKQLYNVNA